MFKVEKKVPVPKSLEYSERNTYPFEDMKVGDSFFVPEEDITPSKVRAAVWNYARNNGVRFRTHQLSKKGVKGIRVWRTE